MGDYYTILECSPEATFEELKRNYQRLVKKHHPDKGSTDCEQFQKIDEAYKVLRDEKSRRDYDAVLVSRNSGYLIYAELSREKLVLNGDGVFLYPCRCGEEFVVEREHLEEEECVIECSECSNSILIR